MTHDSGANRPWRAAPLAFLVMLLLLAAAVRAPGVYVRSIWYDETITLLETSSGPTDWPDRPTPAGELRVAFEGTPPLRDVTEHLRTMDVHPPIYYWFLNGWRALLGRSIEPARWFSLLVSVGAVAVFWWLLRRAGIENPWMPTAVFALSKYAVHYGHEARGYALATLLLLSGLAVAMVALQVASRTRGRATALAWLASVLLASSFLTNYLTLFAIVVILGWMGLVSGRESRRQAAVTACATPLLSIGGLLLLRFQGQFGARPGQDVGFGGYLNEAVVIARGLTEIVCRVAGVPWVALSVLLGVLIGFTITVARERGPLSPWERRLVGLSVCLVIAQAVGVYAMDLLMDKHLATARYLLFAGPPLAILAGLGARHAIGRARLYARAFVSVLLILQVSGVNWSLPDCRVGRSFGPYRSVVKELRAEGSGPALAVIGSGFGRGDPWSWVYELPAETPALFLGWNDDGSKVVPFVGDFSEVWILGASDGRTRSSEEALRDRLVSEGWRPLPKTSWRGAVRLGNPVVLRDRGIPGRVGSS